MLEFHTFTPHKLIQSQAGTERYNTRSSGQVKMRRAIFDKIKRKRSDGEGYSELERGRSRQGPRSIPTISIPNDKSYIKPEYKIDSYRPRRDSRRDSRSSSRYRSASCSPSLHASSSRDHRYSPYISSPSSLSPPTWELHSRYDSYAPDYLSPKPYGLHRYNSQSSGHSSNTSLASAGAKRLEKLGCEVYPKDKFQVGMIIWAPMHEQPYDTSDPEQVSESPWGPVFSKFRPFIIGWSSVAGFLLMFDMLMPHSQWHFSQTTILRSQPIPTRIAG